MIIFIRKNFLDCRLDLEDFFDYMNILEERNVNFLSINTVGMHQIGGSEYNFIESDKVKTKFIHGQDEKDACN